MTFSLTGLSPAADGAQNDKDGGGLDAWIVDVGVAFEVGRVKNLRTGEQCVALPSAYAAGKAEFHRRLIVDAENGVQTYHGEITAEVGKVKDAVAGELGKLASVKDAALLELSKLEAALGSAAGTLGSDAQTFLTGLKSHLNGLDLTTIADVAGVALNVATGGSAGTLLSGAVKTVEGAVKP